MNPTKESSDGAWSPQRRPLMLAVVCLVTVVAFESLAISTVMPIVERDLGDIWLYGWVFSGFYLGTLIGVVVGGRAVDRIAPIGPMLLGVAVFVVGLAVGGLAQSMHVLVAGRFLQGLGAGVVPAVSYVVVARGFPSRQHPTVFAVMSSAWILPALISPLAASIIARHFSWRWVFLGLIPVTIVVAAVGSRPISRVSAERAPDRPVGDRSVVRVVLLAVGAAFALGGLGMDRIVIGLPLAAVGVVVMLPMFIRLTPPGTLTARPRLPAAVLARGMATFAFFTSDAYLSLAVTSVRHATTTYAGFALVGSSSAWTAGSWFQAKRGQILGPTHMVRTGGLLLLVGALGMVASLSQAVPLWVWILSSSTMGFGMGTAYTTISVVTLSEAETGREGEATAALQLCDILGVALGTGIGGVLVTIGARGGSSPWIALALVFGCSALMAAGLASIAGRLSRTVGAGVRSTTRRPRLPMIWPTWPRP